MDDEKIEAIFGLFMMVTNNKTWFYVAVITFTILFLVGGVLFWWCMRRSIAKIETQDDLNYDQVVDDDGPISKFDSTQENLNANLGGKAIKPTDSTMAKTAGGDGVKTSWGSDL